MKRFNNNEINDLYYDSDTFDDENYIESGNVEFNIYYFSKKDYPDDKYKIEIVDIICDQFKDGLCHYYATIYCFIKILIINLEDNTSKIKWIKLECYSHKGEFVCFQIYYNHNDNAIDRVFIHDEDITDKLERTLKFKYREISLNY